MAVAAAAATPPVVPPPSDDDQLSQALATALEAIGSSVENVVATNPAPPPPTDPEVETKALGTVRPASQIPGMSGWGFKLLLVYVSELVN